MTLSAKFQVTCYLARIFYGCILTKANWDAQENFVYIKTITIKYNQRLHQVGAASRTDTLKWNSTKSDTLKFKQTQSAMHFLFKPISLRRDALQTAQQRVGGFGSVGC